MLESELTPPRPGCPHPEHWHAHDGMATEIEIIELVAAFVRALQPELVIETGAHRGFASRAIGEALKTNGHGILYTTEIDHNLWWEAQMRTVNLPVVCHEKSSLDLTPPGPIDFAWFDSETNLRVTEFKHYLPWMHERTVVGFHDTSPHHGYRPQLDTLGLSWLDLPTPRGVTFGRVGSEWI